MPTTHDETALIILVWLLFVLSVLPHGRGSRLLGEEPAGWVAIVLVALLFIMVL